jgi:putative hydrolase of the HAD superfamily
MIKGVIFDLDDTIISEKKYIKSGFRVVCKVISEQHNLSFDKVYKKIFELFDEDSDYVFNRLLDCFNIEYDKEYILKLLKTYRNHEPNIELYSDAEKIINYLSGKDYKLGIITDGYQITQKRKIDKLNLRDKFDCIVITDELGSKYWKPHKLPYQKCLNKLKLNFNEVIYVGDNLKKDFITANKLGIKTVQIVRKDGIYNKSNNLSDEYQADHKIDNLNEIIKIYNL